MTLKKIAQVFDAVRTVDRPLCVFDIDSTLMNTGPRSHTILREAARELFPDLASFVARLDPLRMAYHLIDDLRRLGFDNEKELAAVDRFWATRFFTDAYVLHDIPYPGAVEYVRDLHKDGVFIYYLSGRDEPNMGKGTRASFVKHGFPLDDRTAMHLKPDFAMNDLRFKRDAFADIKALGYTTVAIFENEPANANAFKEHFHDAAVFLIRTITSNNPAPLRADVVPFDSFEDR